MATSDCPKENERENLNKDTNGKMSLEKEKIQFPITLQKERGCSADNLCYDK